ncbi:MAG: DUF4136 domain-containing protein [Ginsengibacter sp.]|jgi:hypothetical protein
MKKLLFFITACMTFTMSSFAQSVKVGADNSFKESLNKYTTFGWSADIDKISSDAIFLAPGGVYIFNNESTRSKIKEAINFELNAKGYTETETNPQVLVLFEVTEQPGKIVTFNGYDMIDGEKTRTAEDKQKVDIKAGTLLINLVDAKSGLVAWQGYASGILNPDMINDNVKVREAVAAIFHDFKFHAKK